MTSGRSNHEAGGWMASALSITCLCRICCHTCVQMHFTLAIVNAAGYNSFVFQSDYIPLYFIRGLGPLEVLWLVFYVVVGTRRTTKSKAQPLCSICINNLMQYITRLKYSSFFFSPQGLGGAVPRERQRGASVVAALPSCRFCALLRPTLQTSSSGR